MTKYNIIQIFNKMDYGGAELRTIDILKNLNNNKYKMYFCSLSGEKGALDEEIRKLGGEVIYCKLKHPLFPYKFIKILIKKEINVVHSNIYFFSGVILFLAKLANVKKRIAHFRTTSSGKKKNILSYIKYNILKKMVLIYSTNILGVSKTSLEENFGKKAFKDRRFQVLYNGIDVKRFNKVKNEEKLRIIYKIPENDIIFIHIGRMNEAKNHYKVIEVFNTYLKQEGSAQLFLIGKKDEKIKKNLDKKIKKYNIAENVHYLGIQSDIYTFLNQADIFIFPSIREGLPGVVLEATISGLPVIASDIKPTQEIAQYFNTIRCLKNSEPNSQWVNVIVHLLASKPKYSVIYEQFLRSPFTISKSVEKYKKIMR